jgi:hypothetical protein
VLRVDGRRVAHSRDGRRYFGDKGRRGVRREHAADRAIRRVHTGAVPIAVHLHVHLRAARSLCLRARVRRGGERRQHKLEDGGEEPAEAT